MPIIYGLNRVALAAVLITAGLILFVVVLQPVEERRLEVIVRVENIDNTHQAAVVVETPTVPTAAPSTPVVVNDNTEQKIGTVIMCEGTEMFGRNESLLMPARRKKFVTWTNDNDKLFVEPKTKVQHAQCLRGKKILFIGDSILRYSYLALLNILDKGFFSLNETVHQRSNQFLGSFPTADPGEETKTQVETPIENEHPLWQKTYANWSRFLDQSTGSGHCCDCYRSPFPLKLMNKIRRSLKFKELYKKGIRKPGMGGTVYSSKKQKSVVSKHWISQRENRFYRNDSIQTDLSFFFMHGDYGSHGTAHSYSSNCSRGYDLKFGHTATSRTGLWTGSIYDLINHLSDKHETYDAVVLTAGLWYPRNIFMHPQLENLFEGVEKLSKGKLIWLPTSYPCHKPPGDQEHIVLETLPKRPRKWDMLDLRTITRCLGMSIGVTDDVILAAPDITDLSLQGRENCSKAYVDETGHFQPFVYREFTNLIVEALCGD